MRVLATGLRWMEGWVPGAALRKLSVDQAGYRVLMASDIDWQPGSERDRATILKIANQILREDKRCEAIDNRSLLVEGDRADRRYTLGCDGPAGSHAVTFQPGDAGRRSFAVAAIDPRAEYAPPLPKAEAAVACMNAVTNGLTQPGSADFHTFTDTSYTTNGPRARVTIGFSAKNGIGLEMEATAACIFEGEMLTSAEVLPAGQ